MAFDPRQLLEWVDKIQTTIATENKTATIEQLKELQLLLKRQLGFIKLGNALEGLINDEATLSDRTTALYNFQDAVKDNYKFTGKLKAEASEKLSTITITVDEVAPWDDTITVSVGEKTPQRVVPVQSKSVFKAAKESGKKFTDSINAATAGAQKLFKDKQTTMTKRPADATAAEQPRTTGTTVKKKSGGDGRKV